MFYECVIRLSWTEEEVDFTNNPSILGLEYRTPYNPHNFCASRPKLRTKKLWFTCYHSRPFSGKAIKDQRGLSHGASAVQKHQHQISFNHIKHDNLYFKLEA